MTVRAIAASVDTPVRKAFLPFNQPDIEQAEIEEVVDTLRSGCITTCPNTRQFETEFAARVEAKYTAAANSCMATSHLLMTCSECFITVELQKRG